VKNSLLMSSCSNTSKR